MMFFNKNKKIDIEQIFHHIGGNSSYTIFLKHIPKDLDVTVSDLDDKPLLSDNYTVLVFDRSFYGKGVTIVFKDVTPMDFKVKIN